MKFFVDFFANALDKNALSGQNSQAASRKPQAARA